MPFPERTAACVVCNTSFVTRFARSKYCPPCKQQVRREQLREAQRAYERSPKGKTTQFRYNHESRSIADAEAVAASAGARFEREID